MEKLPYEVKIIVARYVKETWGLTKILEIWAREACILKTAENGKNGSDNYEGFPYTGSFLHINSQYHNQGQKFTNIKCVFFRHGHWSDKCSLITDPEAKKNFWKEKVFCFLCLKSSHGSRNCPKKKTCYYCKGIHNSAVCENKSKQGKSKSEQLILTIEMRQMRPPQITLRI